MDFFFKLGKPGRSSLALGGRTLKRPGTSALLRLWPVGLAPSLTTYFSAVEKVRNGYERPLVAFGCYGSA